MVKLNNSKMYTDTINIVNCNNTTIDFKPIEKTHIPQAVNLINSQYVIKKTENYFLWQYFDSYQQAALIGAYFKNEIIGMSGIQKRKLQNGTNIGILMDLIINPKWQGRGITLSLIEKTIHSFANIDAVIGFPNAKGRNVLEKRGKFKNLGRINAVVITAKDINTSACSNIQKMNEKFFEFEYSKRFLTQRFNQHPLYKYDYVNLSSEIFAVTKIFIDPTKNNKIIGDIVYFNCDLNNESIARDLFLKAILHLKEKSAEIITTWILPHISLYKVLKLIGFLELSQERYLCLKVLNSRYEYLYDFARWHIVQADTEIF